MMMTVRRREEAVKEISLRVLFSSDQTDFENKKANATEKFDLISICAVRKERHHGILFPFKSS